MVQDAVYELEDSKNAVQRVEEEEAEQESDIDESINIAQLIADQVLVTRYQRNKLQEVEVCRDEEIIFLGTIDQVPEINKLSEADYDLLEDMPVIPTAAELSSTGSKKWSVRINKELVFAIEEYKVTRNESLSMQELKALEKFDEMLRTQGEEQTNGSILYEDEEYTVEYSVLNGLSVMACDSREVVNSLQGRIAILEEDYSGLQRVQPSQTIQLEL
jgi:hypothetical protein